MLTFYIVAADRNIGVTALTQRHKIFIVVCAAVCKRKDVVHFLCGRQAVMLYNKARGICLVVIWFIFHQAALGSAVYHQARKSGSLGVVASGVWLPAKGAAPCLEP